MRHLGWLVALATLTGCDLDLQIDWDSYSLDQAGPPEMEPGFLRHESGMSGWGVNGTHVSRDREWGVVGLSQMTCQVYLADASMGTDMDIGTGDDEIEDGEEIEETGGDVVLVSSFGGQIDEVEMPSGVVLETYTVPDHVASQITTDGFAALTFDGSRCGVEWHGDNGFSRTELPSSYCDRTDEIEYSAELDTVYVPGHENLAGVTRDTYTELGIPASSVVFDPLTATLYTTVDGAPNVSAYDPDGTAQWSTDLSGSVHGLDDMGDLGTIVASVQRDDGFSDVVVLDATTGEVTAQQGIRREPGPIQSSSDGGTITMAERDRFDFFSVNSNDL